MISRLQIKPLCDEPCVKIQQSWPSILNRMAYKNPPIDVSRVIGISFAIPFGAQEALYIVKSRIFNTKEIEGKHGARGYKIIELP